jgi:hypothetical protein
MSLIGHFNGYYDETGNWQRTKFCFMDCGHNCNCRPPGMLYYSAAHDKRLQKKDELVEAIGAGNARRTQPHG